VVENVTPAVDAGRFPIKRTVGETVSVEADVHADGHDEIVAILCHRAVDAGKWIETRMEPMGNDRYRGTFAIDRLAPHAYTVLAWVDAFRTWRRALARRAEAALVEPVDLHIGAQLLSEAADRAGGSEGASLRAAASALRSVKGSGRVLGEAVDRALSDELLRLSDRNADRSGAVRSEPELRVAADRERARFSAWYEMFPRSASPLPGRHGTLADCLGRLDYLAALGFDVLYLPPIHPIGRTNRKGRNNATVAGPDDVGSPWAIGSREGGHKAVHPDLGTVEDLGRLVAAARDRGIEVALDLAFQCAPDHPYVADHPEWFRWRPDGRVQFAENPPKKYEDIYPLNFEGEGWPQLWDELLSVVAFWIGQGVRIFRVDNPHTKPFRFWEWLIGEVRKDHPDVLFLAEAFTRPKIMYQLAKLGFTQSYTYFAWRNTKHELTQYFTELTRTGVADFFRPNLWPNTPDILPEALQYGGPPVFRSRLVLAATLGASYGIYGPAYELCEARPRAQGSEEYLDSEKYEVRHWDLDRHDSLRDFIGRINRIRRENPALQADRSLAFHRVENEQLIAFSKATADLSNIVLVVVNLDPHHVHSGWVELPLETFGLSPEEPYQVHDLLTDAHYLWNGPRNFVEVDPKAAAHVMRLRRRLRTERDFDYFL
jgi:starch synthase (maltosyl-transferring)